MTKKQETEIRDLNERLTKAGRSLLAHREWFFCATVRKEPSEFVEVEGTGMSVEVLGAQRAPGGTCLVHVEGRPCGEPVLLDDLVEDWSRDPAADIRYAAAQVRRVQEKSCEVKAAS